MDSASPMYVDEEDCLGFKIWVAELELLVGSSRGRRKANPGHVHRLLQKLVATLDRAGREEIREYQRKAEDALIDILLKGAPPPVRRLVCEALGRLYGKGDQLPLFSRVSSLQLFLGTKEAASKETSEDVRLGALELATSLYYSQGRSLAIGVNETATLAARYCARGLSDRTRRAALRLMAAAVEGVGGAHRGAVAVQAEALKALERVLKEKDPGESVRLGVADVIRAVAAAGGAHLWANGMIAYETVRSACLAGIHDDVPAVRAAYAQALAEIVSSSQREDAQQSIASAGTRAKHHQAQERALAAVIEECLMVPFVENALSGDRPACAALAQAWALHLTSTRVACGADESAFVQPALRPLEALTTLCTAAGSTLEKGPSGTDTELGAGLGGGERPHAQACMLYILRSGVVEQLGEVGQRLLLEKCSRLLLPPASGPSMKDVDMDEEVANSSKNSSSGGYNAAAAAAAAATTPTTETAAAASTANAQRPLTLPAAVRIVVLELTALLTEALGEVGSEAGAALEKGIGLALAAPHSAVRTQAASTLAALAVAEPSSAARLLGSALGNLRAAADALVEESTVIGVEKVRATPGTPRGLGAGKVSVEMDAVHGWALASSALLAVVPRLPLGVPSYYIRAAVQIATALIEAPRSRFGPAACVEREAGYVMLGTLCHMAMPFLEESTRSQERSNVLSLWQPTLGPEATAALEALLTAKESEHTLAAELWWRSAALRSLQDYFAAFSSSSSSASPQSLSSPISPRLKAYKAWTVEERDAVLLLLRPLISLLTSSPLLQQPFQLRGGQGSAFAAALAKCHLRLLRTCAMLPASWMIAVDFAGPLWTLCMSAVKSLAAGGMMEPLQLALQAGLDPIDNHLGPWNAGRDPLEQELLLFNGATGGPLPSAWRVGQRAGVGYALQEASSSSSPCSASNASVSTSSEDAVAIAGMARLFPQAESLAGALFVAQSQVSGQLMRASAPLERNKMLGALLELAETARTAKAKKERDATKRTVPLLATAIPVISAFGRCGFSIATDASPHQPHHAASPRDSDSADKIQALAEMMVEEANSGIVLHRIAGDLYAAAGRLGSDASALRLLQSLCHRAAETPSLPQRAALTMGIGAVARAIGGLGLATALAQVTQTLTALAQASDMAIAPAILHALTSCAHAAGLSFVPHVPDALAIAQSVLLQEDIYSVAGLLPAVGRLANATVAALGPDYALGSPAYDACRSVVTELRAPDATGVRSPEDMLAGALESVLYAQMLVLFAPRALPLAQHVAVLVATLPSRQPQLRKVAVDTLRHLAERDVVAVLAERVEPGLFAALDGETVPATAAQLQATIETLLHGGAGSEPTWWIRLCGEVIAAAGPQDRTRQESNGDGNGGGGGGGVLGGDYDDDGGSVGNDGFSSNAHVGVNGASSVHAAAASANSTPYRGGALSSSATPGVANAAAGAITPRLRTKIFAARCLLQIPGLACSGDTNAAAAGGSGGDYRHWDPIAAQSDILGGDWLVLRLQELIEMGFRMSTGQLDGLRGLGVELLLEVLKRLGAAQDPLCPGEPLLAQYQAQYVSTLRASLHAKASPAVQASGAALAAAFLEKGLAGGDAAVLDRLLGLLCGPLSVWVSGGPDPAQAAYAEWVAIGARVALLESHAHCAAAAARGVDSAVQATVIRAQGPFLTLLVDCWVGLLHDYAVLRTQPPAAASSRHRLALTGRTVTKLSDKSKAPLLASVAEGIGPALSKAWPVVLDAAAATLLNDRTAAYGPSGKERHAALLDIALAAVHWAQGQNNETIGVLEALRKLTAPRFCKEGWIDASLTSECVELVLHNVLLRRSSTTGSKCPLEAAEHAAAMLEQLSLALEAPAAVIAQGEEARSEALRDNVLQAAQACIERRGTHATTVSSALAAASNVLRATPAMQQSKALFAALDMPLKLLDEAPGKTTPEQLAAAVSHVQVVARMSAGIMAATLSLPPHSKGAHGPSSIAEVLGVAAITAAGRALQLGTAAPGSGGEGCAEQVGAYVSSFLALGAVATTSWGAHRNGGSTANARTSPPAVPLHQSADAFPAVDSSQASIRSENDDADWGDDDDLVFSSAEEPLLQKCSPPQRTCLAALQSLLTLPASPRSADVVASTCRAVRTFLQMQPPPIWAAQCASVALPPAATSVHAALRSKGKDISKEPSELEAATAVLALGATTCTLGGDVQDAALGVVVPLLVESAAPSGSAPEATSASALSQVAVKLLTSLATGSAGLGFKAAVASLPESTKQRLQQALAASVASANAGAASVGESSAASGMRLPTIQLKNFT